MDLMYVNKIPFLVTISKSIKFGTVTHLQNKSVATLNNAIDRICGLYAARSFRVILIKADHEFDACRAHLESQGVTLNVTAEDEHVPEAERYIRTIKERSRGIYNLLPFQHLPRRLLLNRHIGP
jgi:hypothetical protein